MCRYINRRNASGKHYEALPSNTTRHSFWCIPRLEVAESAKELLSAIRREIWLKQDMYLTTTQLAKRLGVSTRTLERWRSKGRGIRCTIWGHKALYHVDDVEDFENQKRRLPATLLRRQPTRDFEQRMYPDNKSDHTMDIAKTTKRTEKNCRILLLFLPFFGLYRVSQHK